MSKNFWPGQAEAIIERARRRGMVAEPLAPAAVAAQPAAPKRAGKRRREMNGIESRFSEYLNARLRRGEIAGFGYEQMMLRFGCADAPLSYSPDFTVRELSGSLTQIEIKGAYCWKADLVRWKAAKASFPWFRFEWWTCENGIWQETR